MHIISMATMKGGVGKTTSSHAIATVLSQTERVLLIDIDPQATLTKAMSIEHPSTIADALINSASPFSIVKPLTDRLAMIPSEVGLAEAELLLVARWVAKNYLAEFLHH